MLGKVTLKGNGDSGRVALTSMLRSHLKATSTHLSCSGLASTQWLPNMGSAFWSVVTMALSRNKKEIPRDVAI